MPISNSYPKGIPIEDQDLFVGTKAYNNRTVNYTAQSVADYLNINSKVAIGGQMSFQFTIVPNIPKTIAFEGGGGNNTAFSAITKLIVSAIDVSTANITIFLNYLNNSQVLLSQQNQPNFFGHYKITGYTQISTSAFYELDLEFIGGNGTIGDKQYYDLVSFVLSTEVPPTEWGSITGDIEDQTDLIDYISSQITTPTLQEVLAEGNTTGGENIVINDADAIQLENASTLKKGTYDFGADGGISRICGVGFEDMWQSGIRHVFDSNGLIRNSTNCFDIIPDETFDDTLRFKIDSLWTLDNGTSYVCLDATTGAAEWELISQIPSLQSVLDFDHHLINGNNFQGDLAGAGNTGVNVNAFGSTAAFSNSGADINVFGFGSLMVNSGNNVNAFGSKIGGGNVYNSVNLFGYQANADGNNQLVLSKGSYFELNFMARLSFNDITEDRKYELPDASGTIALTSDIPAAGVTSVGLTMPSAFTVTNSPITSNGDIAVTGAGLVSQYVRGDGTLANFPASTGGGASLSFYLNGSVSQGTIGGVAYKEMNGVPVIGAGTDFTINADGYIAQFITDAGDPNKLLIPAGNWNFESYFSASSGGGSPKFYIELYKYDGTTFTLIASNSATPENITGSTSIDLYFTALAVPPTVLLATDRLAVRFYVIHSGRTITMHTEDSHLSQIITTFTTGLTALNGLTQQVQNLAVGTSGTDFAISSVTDTHTFNLPTASATNRGALSSADWSTFNGKQNALGYTPVTDARTLTINGTAYDLTADRSWTITASGKSINTVSVNTSAGSASSTDYVYLASGTINITLPTAVGNQNLYTIKNVGTGVITVDTTSSETIDGSLTAPIRVQYLSLTLVSDGANWNII